MTSMANSLMDRDEYKKYLRMLAEELQKQEVTGEILVAEMIGGIIRLTIEEN